VKLSRLLIGTGLLAILTACGGSANVTPQLMRIASASRLNVSSALTIESLKVPIRSIALTETVGTSGVTVYECAAGTNDGCLVELADATSLENLLTGAGATSIAAGTYNGVQISTCLDEGSYTAKIKASGKIDPSGGGSTYYTQATSGALTTTLADYGTATVHFTGCSRNYPLPSPVTVTDGASVDVKLYFDMRDIAFFGDAAAGEAYFAGGYSYEYPAVPPGTYVGVNYLDVAGTVDSGTPTIERYRITTSTGQRATIGLMFTSGGDYFGGFSRSYFDTATTQAHNSFVTPIQTFEVDSTGTTYTLKNYGSSATGDGYFNTTGFVRATNASPVAWTDYTGASGGTFTSERLP
jgi:hypothetical protein